MTQMPALPPKFDRHLFREMRDSDRFIYSVIYNNSGWMSRSEIAKEIGRPGRIQPADIVVLERLLLLQAIETRSRYVGRVWRNEYKVKLHPDKMKPWQGGEIKNIDDLIVAVRDGAVIREDYHHSDLYGIDIFYFLNEEQIEFESDLYYLVIDCFHGEYPQFEAVIVSDEKLLTKRFLRITNPN